MSESDGELVKLVARVSRKIEFVHHGGTVSARRPLITTAAQTSSASRRHGTVDPAAAADDNRTPARQQFLWRAESCQAARLTRGPEWTRRAVERETWTVMSNPDPLRWWDPATRWTP